MDGLLISTLINLLLYIYFIEKYYDTKEDIFAYVQFGLSFPLTIVLFDLFLENTIHFGWILIFMLPILSLIILVDMYYYKRNKK
jgi:hypothetical protein